MKNELLELLDTVTKSAALMSQDEEPNDWTLGYLHALGDIIKNIEDRLEKPLDNV